MHLKILSEGRGEEVRIGGGGSCVIGLGMMDAPDSCAVHIDSREPNTYFLKFVSRSHFSVSLVDITVSSAQPPIII